MVTVAIWFLAYSRQVDMGVFRFAGGNLLHGRPLYAVGLTGQRDGHLFNYPPFAAVVFIPLAALPVDLLRLIVPFANLAVLALAIRRCWRALGIESGGWELRSLTMLCTGALLWLEPVRTNVILGQINIVLLAIVLFDLLPLRTGARWTGAGVGLAAGIKLTPLLFIPFLARDRSAPRRRRRHRDVRGHGAGGVRRRPVAGAPVLVRRHVHRHPACGPDRLDGERVAAGADRPHGVAGGHDHRRVVSWPRSS